MIDASPPSPAAAEPSIVTVGLKGACPRCSAPTLFDGLLAFAKRCPACSLNFESFNVGDGPAAFLTLIIGALVSIAAISFELTLHPPWWLHVILWVPITIGLVIGSLRIAKGMLLASEYRNRAREGQVAPVEPSEP